MLARRTRIFAAAGLAAAAAGSVWFGLHWARPVPHLTEAEFAAHFAKPLPPLAGPIPIYHLGHSLVGRDMPAMLAQLGGQDHASQLGWGATLKGHWTGDVPGFETENAHPYHRPAGEALDSGDYPVVVLTEMVEIRDAIRYFDSPTYLATWAERIRNAQPEARIYLYETWHRLDDAEGWLERLDRDLARHWEGDLLRRAMARQGVGTIHVIPGGQVMAAVARAAEAGEIPFVTRREDLFAVQEDGSVDPIHFNDLGAYLMALTHFAVIYHRSPLGLSHDVKRADGQPITPIAPETAEALQRIVWQVVTSYAPTGVARG